jgi:hypothetical protein
MELGKWKEKVGKVEQVTFDSCVSRAIQCACKYLLNKNEYAKLSKKALEFIKQKNIYLEGISQRYTGESKEHFAAAIRNPAGNEDWAIQLYIWFEGEKIRTNFSEYKASDYELPLTFLFDDKVGVEGRRKIAKAIANPGYVSLIVKDHFHIVPLIKATSADECQVDNNGEIQTLGHNRLDTVDGGNDQLLIKRK